MDVAGLCDLCGRPVATFSCQLCGKRMCQRCMTVGGVCKACTDGRDIRAETEIVDRMLREKGIDPKA